MRAGIFTTTIQEIRQIGDDTRNFRVALPENTVFDFKAGQFVNFLLDIPGAPKTLKRPYSIASPPSWKGVLEFIWKRVPGGLATNHLWNLKEGDTLGIQGPLGIFSAKHPLPKTIVFVSTGTGVAPFRAMIHQLVHEKAECEIWNIFGTRYENQVLYQEEFEALAAQNPNVRNVFTVSRPESWKGEREYVQVMLRKYIQNVSDAHLYICGLTAMIREVESTALDMGFSHGQIFYEKYD